MTAKSRVRKLQKKLRRAESVNAQSQHVRRSEEAGIGGLKPTHVTVDEVILDAGIDQDVSGTKVIENATLRSVHLNAKGLGFLEEAAERTAKVFDEYRLAVGEEAEESLDFKHRVKDLLEEAVRPKAAPDAAPVSERGTAEAEVHFHFWDKEVEGLLEHSHFDPCWCPIGADHNSTVGEN